MFENIAEKTQYQEKESVQLYVRSMPADLETPASVYLKVAGDSPSFLLESVSGGEQVARYSFIGVSPRKAFVFRNDCMEIHEGDEIITTAIDDPLYALSDALQEMKSIHIPGMPRFTGGLAGYLGYETMRYFEPSIPLKANENMPDAIFMMADTIIAFDHAFGKIMLIATPRTDMKGSAAQDEAQARLDEIEEQIAGPLPSAPSSGRQSGTGKTSESTPLEMQSNMTPAQYMQAVEKAKTHIAAGDIFQVVPSQRLSRETEANPFDIYRALRRLNPSPYMFYFNFGMLAGDEPLHLIGASPEMHVRYEEGEATLRPIAGTRRRGASDAEDEALADDLMNDPKERAEHVMLVDLARNDLGRVCDYGSVHVPELMQVEKYSHVMHIVSKVQGALRPDMDAFQLLRATFPAGTVSGAPKIRAMQIIDEMEHDQRGPYAGAVGYIGADGCMDTCIAIRTLVMRGKTVSVQAGAGIVADSDPESEYYETMNKAKALAVAVEMAEKETGLIPS
jgi:anthranilate synthase component I